MKRGFFEEQMERLRETMRSVPIPPWALRWIRVSEVLYHDVLRCDVPKQASAMAYTTLVSIVPSLAALFSILTLFLPLLGQDNQIMERTQSFIISNLAQGTGDQVAEVLNGFIARLNIKQIGISGFAAMLVTMILLLRQIEIALNGIWMVRKERGFFTRVIYFWTFLTLGAFAGALTVGSLSGFDIQAIIAYIDFTDDGGEGAIRSSPFVSFLASFIFFFFLNKVGPNCKISFKEAVIGATISAVLFRIAGAGFGFYVQNFSRHAAIYGALAALPLFLLWIYISWVIILFGSVVSWRCRQGMPSEEEQKEAESEEIGAEMRLRSKRIQTMAPVLCLMEIYRVFDSGDGQGISGTGLMRSLNLPQAWVADAIENLEDLHYIIAAVDNRNLQSGTDPMSTRYFPSSPASMFKVEKIYSTLLESSRASLEKWNRKIPEVHIETVTQIQTLGKDSLKDATVRHILDKSA